MPKAHTRAGATPALWYLESAGQSLARVRADAQRLAKLGESMARTLLQGGALFTPPVSNFWPSEFMHRAGGMMGIRPSNHVAESKNDVAYIALPDPRRKNEKAMDRLAALVKSPARIFVNGCSEDLPRGVSASRFEGFSGTCPADAGEYSLNGIDPLVPLRPLEQMVRGWSMGAELVTACIRGGHMPILWMSVWLEGAMVRNNAFVKHDNVREPWYTPLFHDEWYVPPLPPTYATMAFVDFLEPIRAGLVAQADKLAKAGRWLAEAKRNGRRAFAVLTGHSYPAVLEIEKDSQYPLEWGSSISDLRRALPEDMKEGDAALHLGYGPTKNEDVELWTKRGVKLIHSSPFGRTKGLRDQRNFLWIDLPWRPADACVDIPGYSVRLIPSSSSTETMAYFAILAEMAEAM